MGSSWGDLVVCSGLLFVELAVVPGLGEGEDNQDRGKGDNSDIEPPEWAPSHGLSHGTSNDRSNHERTHVRSPIDGVPETTVVQKENVGNNSGLN